MNRERIIIKRESLYKEVWKTSVNKLAPKYGVSNVALKKICKKLNVPTPPRGYWARLQWGYKVERTKLPKLKPGDPETHVIFERLEYMKNTPTAHLKNTDLPKEIDVVKEIKVHENLEDPHRLIKRTERALLKTKSDERGMIQSAKKILDIHVSSAQLNRALRIMDALLKGFEEVDYKITNDGAVYIDGVKILLSINEKNNRIVHVPTKEDKLKIKRNRFFHGVPNWDYIPTGKLQFNYKINGARGLQKQWADSSIRKLESLIDKIIIGGIKAAKAYQIEQKELEERRKRWEEERRKREEEAVRRAEEKRLLKVFEEQADNWAKAERLRAFIKAVEQSGIENVRFGDGEISLQEWLSWARRHADSFDPLFKKT